MLSRIMILNSKVYGKAEIRLDNCDSLQLVGPNNVGKSTLIYTLNFLFIIDGTKMSFSGNRRGDKETVHHYFPTHNQSYIVFEIKKRLSTYSILVKRNTDGDLEYYRYEAGYEEEHYFVGDSKSQKLLKWEEVQLQLEKSGLSLHQFANKTEVFNAVYQRGNQNDSVVWLEENVKADGLSNNFSKIYRYLINTKLITNKTLKEALIIADNRENETLNFSQKNKKDINDLLRINNEIKNIKIVKNDFYEFREIVNQFRAKSKVLGELHYAFDKSYSETIPAIENKLTLQSKEIGDRKVELNEILYPQKQELDRKVGRKEGDILNRNAFLDEKEKRYRLISSLEPRDFLMQQLENLEKQRKEIEYNTTKVESENISVKQLEYRLRKQEEVVEALEVKIKNYNTLLMHQISDDENTRKMLGAVLSEQVLTLSDKKIKKKVGKVADLLKIFDGEVDIKGLEPRQFETVEVLKSQLAEEKLEMERIQKLHEVANNYEKSLEELKDVNNEIVFVKQKLEDQNSKPKLEKEIQMIRDEIQELKNEKEEIEVNIRKSEEEIGKKTNVINDLIDANRIMQERIRELKNWRLELQESNIPFVECDNSESIEQIYGKIKLFSKDKLELKTNKDKQFDKLREKLENNLASEDDFIKYMEEEIACLNDKEKSIDGLLQSISTQFANPAYALIKRYEEFKSFIANKFNEKLSSTAISNIESMKINLVDNHKLVNEILKISAIQDLKGNMLLEFDQSENLIALNNYLDTQRKVHFDELFDIELEIMLKGTIKKVDLGGQVESDGTDRMIRLVIIMAVINRLAINTEENRIALFIDEVATIDKHNRPQLVDFCRSHNFIPIFAAPDPVPGFGKYYFIYRDKGPIFISDAKNALFAENNKVPTMTAN
jgi:energy-coupling factor transporter ATP-binding protein EcfA2